jgi:1-phosphofructokinase
MPTTPAIITVSLNPAIDRTIEVDSFTVGAHQPGREIRRTPGGKAVNVSRTLAALGVRTIATGFLGEDNRSGFDVLFRKTLVNDQFFTLPGRTRENVTIADLATHQETHIRDRGLEIPRRALDRLDKKLKLLARSDSIVIFSGSLPPGIGADDFHDLVSHCIGAGARVAVDTGGEALRAMASLPLWLIKPNGAELSKLVGRPLQDAVEQVQAARELAARVTNVLLTRGGEGAYLVTADLALHARVPVPADRVCNTVGCGDALLGAFVAGVWRAQSPREALARAVALATAAACTLGPAEFDPETLDQFRSQVEITELEGG